MSGNTQQKSYQPRGLVRETTTTQPKSSIRLLCGDCCHYKGTAHPSMGQPCSKLGVSNQDHAPDCYSPNVSVFRTLAPDAIRTIAVLVSAFTPEQSRAFIGVLRSQAACAKRGFQLMQTVYFKLGMGDALDQYYRGWVFSASADGNVTVVGQRYIDSGKTSCVAVLDRNSLFTRAEFKRIKDGMIARGLLNSLPQRERAKISAEDYEPPTLDTAEALLEQRAAQAAKPKGRRAQSRHLNDAQDNDRSTVFSIDQSHSSSDEEDGL